MFTLIAQKDYIVLDKNSYHLLTANFSPVGNKTHFSPCRCGAMLVVMLIFCILTIAQQTNIQEQDNFKPIFEYLTQYLSEKLLFILLKVFVLLILFFIINPPRHVSFLSIQMCMVLILVYGVLQYILFQQEKEENGQPEILIDDQSLAASPSSAHKTRLIYNKSQFPMRTFCLELFLLGLCTLMFIFLWIMDEFLILWCIMNCLIFMLPFLIYYKYVSLIIKIFDVLQKWFT